MNTALHLKFLISVLQDDVMLPQRVRQQYEASLNHPNSVSASSSIFLLTSFPHCCPSPLLPSVAPPSPSPWCVRHTHSPLKIKNILVVFVSRRVCFYWWACVCASMQLARSTVWVSGVDAFCGLPGRRLKVVCLREVRETAWRQRTCCRAQTACSSLSWCRYFMALD